MVDYFNINAGALSKYWANPNTYNIYRDNNLENTMLNRYAYLFFNVQYKTKNVKIKVEPRTIYEDEFKNKYFSTFDEKANEVSILAYDAVGLIYYCWYSTNRRF